MFTFDESHPFYPRTSPDASHASVIEPLFSYFFMILLIAPMFPPHLVPSSEAPVESPVVPSPVELSSMAPSLVVPSFSEDIPQVPMDRAYDSKLPVTRVYTRTRRVAKPLCDAPSPLDEPSSSVAPFPLDDPSSDVPSLHDATTFDAGSPHMLFVIGGLVLLELFSLS